MVVDTSSVSPCCQKSSGGSKYNLFHATASLELVKKLNASGFIQGKGSVGICTPFASQKRLVQEMVEGGDFGDLVTVGTVHTYQGDEKELMILDIIDGDP